MKTNPPLIRLAPLAAIPAILLSACLGPAYRRPDVATPDAFKELPAVSSETWHPVAPSDAAPKGPWWTMFGDPRLDDLRLAAAAHWVPMVLLLSFRQP